MIVYGRGEYARSEEEVEALIGDVMSNLRQRGFTPDGFEIMPEQALFCIVEDSYPEDADTLHPDNYLHVSVNTTNGFGALYWWTIQAPEDDAEEDVFKFHWTSRNPNPPSFDPFVVEDPGGGTYFPREAAIPVAKIRAALEEFCRNKTGRRPECVDWYLLDPNPHPPGASY
ncbi:Imm1 family immunity protein [Streptomyces polyrhachis]|uniref:Imm1 family immunity protein n=1 Tax=Streptomyces polyrhachis TaxID=1282885 RepID=A0ABW2GGT0_9ACTN